MARKIRIESIPKSYYVLGIILGIISVIFFYSSCSQSSDHEHTYLNHADDVAYVGIAKCAECHSDKHATFIHTGMGLSLDSATREKSSAHFGAMHHVYDSTLDLHYLPFWENDELFIKEYRLDGRDTTHSLTKKINYIVGSGQHTNSHLIMENGYVYQAPITFYVQEGKWDLAPGFENGNNSRFSRILNNECISCHNAMPKMTGKSDYKFQELARGIDCERCHGPGELHVKQREQGQGADVSKGIDYTIVNPRKLSWERQIDVCQRCHLQGLNVLKEGKSFLDFKPGMKLSDVFDIYLPEYEGGNSPFDMANHSDRFQRSECFNQSNNESLEFTCISCHNPHLSVKMTQTAVYNTVCSNCHQTNTCTEEPAVLAKEENNCVSCHMPQSGSEDIPHVSVHDHFIRKPIKQQEAKDLQRLVGLYAVNNPSPKPENEIKAYLEYWEKFDKNPFYLNKAKELLEQHNVPRLWLKYFYLTTDYGKATGLELEENTLTSWEHFMLGTAYFKTQKQSLGLYHIEKAYQLDKTDLLIGKQYVSYLIQSQQIKDASEVNNKLLAEYPSNGLLINNRAKMLILQGRLSQAKPWLEKALKLEPNDMEVWVTWLNYAVQQRDKGQFAYWAERVQKKDPTRLDSAQVNSILESM